MKAVSWKLLVNSSYRVRTKVLTDRRTDRQTDKQTDKPDFYRVPAYSGGEVIAGHWGWNTLFAGPAEGDDSSRVIALVGGCDREWGWVGNYELTEAHTWNEYTTHIGNSN